MKQVIFRTKGSLSEVMADLQEAIALEELNKSEVVEKEELDFTGATPDLER